MLISKGKLPQGFLKDEVAIVTGAGRGIGYEAARALIWLKARLGKLHDEVLVAPVAALTRFWVYCETTHDRT